MGMLNETRKSCVTTGSEFPCDAVACVLHLLVWCSYSCGTVTCLQLHVCCTAV